MQCQLYTAESGKVYVMTSGCLKNCFLEHCNWTLAEKKTFFKACHCGVKNSYFFIYLRNKSHIQKLLLVVNERTRWVSLAKQLRGYKKSRDTVPLIKPWSVMDIGGQRTRQLRPCIVYGSNPLSQDRAIYTYVHMYTRVGQFFRIWNYSVW